MSNSDALEVVNSDDDYDDLQNTTCTDLFQSKRGYPIERKVIDVGGRLGSLYDTSTDNLVDRYIAGTSKPKSVDKHFICRLFTAGESKEPISLLANIGFDNSVRHSIRYQMVIPFGISRLIEYNQPINQNTRFLYYSYRDRQEKLPVVARKADKIVPPPLGPTGATHMISKILWGIEIVCVIQISKNQSVDEIDRLLVHIRKSLKNNKIPIPLTNNDRHLIDQLPNITVFGSDTCVDDPNTSLLTILSKIRDWQRNTNFHQPIIYTMQPLRWLYNNIPFQRPPIRPDTSDSHIDRIQPILDRIENQIKDLREIFHSFPNNFSSAILNQRLKDFQGHYRLLLDMQEELQERLRNTIANVRRKLIEPTALNNIITHLRYQCLHRNDIDGFRINVERLLAKARLIEKLRNNRIEYINAFDICSNGRIPPTNEAIDASLKRTFSNENVPVILWYSGDRLQREQPDEWETVHQQLISERRQATQQIKLVYVDFTQCTERLEKFVIVRLRGTRRDDPITEIVSPPQRTKSASSVKQVPSESSFVAPQRTKSASPVKQVPSESSFLVPHQQDDSLTSPRIVPTRLGRSLAPPSSLSTSQVRRSITPPFVTPKKRDTTDRTRGPVPPPPPKVIEINVLLLGETGVGKSTFINAFVNYLKFQTLDQAERGQPAVLIPVSFLITTGDQFDEFIVKFGDADPNEDYEHQGQSVTQQCKSYVFNINDRLLIRLIDTPGIGDTRGVAQDTKNIDHILTYINTLPHLNAVCLLLKPNASRLNVFFRSCVRQLLTYLTPIGYDNIIFCFTNARATFYAPGDTGRLLREMLNQEHLNDIPFQKQNTFCFDSESFRYLAARKRHIDFDDYQKVECKNSWNTSVAESLRLLKFIQTRDPYALQEYQSPRKAVLDIAMLARPLMETLRLIIYNWKLSEAKLVFNQMILTSNPVAIEMCTHCAQTNTIEVGPFWLTQYQPALLKTNANQHRLCPVSGNDFLIEVIVQHEFAAEGGGLQKERWQSSFHTFLLKCDRLHHFLRQQGPSVEDDPFEPILERFFIEEQQISQIRNINSSMNQRIRQVLQTIKGIRQRNSQQLFEANERLSLNEAYQIIGELLRVDTVKKQIESIQRSRQLIMKTHELRLPANIIKNKTFT